MKEFFTLFLLGSYCSVGIYQLILFSYQKKELNKLFFGILCIFLGITAGLLRHASITEFIPLLSENNINKLIVSAVYLFMPVYLLFLQSLFPADFSRTFVRSAQLAGLAVSAAALIFPAGLWDILNPFFLGIIGFFFFYVFFTLAGTVRKKREGAAWSLTASIFLSFTFIIQAIISGNFPTNQFIGEILVSLGMLVFMLANFPVMAGKTTESLTKLREFFERDKALAKVKDEFLANTLHELQSPAANIIKISESLIEGASGNLNSIQKSNITMIHSAGRRLQTQTNDLFDYLGLRKMGQTSSPDTKNLNKTIQSVCEQFQPLLDRKSVVLENKIISELPPVEVDQNWISQIIFNLVDIAIKYTPSGVISVSHKSSAKYLELTISMAGGAIPKDKLAAAFHSIDRTNFLSHPELDATDLELSIIKSLVESYGGSIWAESSSTQEFRVIFTLPIMITEANQQVIEQAAGKDDCEAAVPAMKILETENQALRQVNQALEEKIRELSFNLEQNNRKLEKISEEINRIEKSRRNLLSNISHDLRSPMTSIQGYVDAILDGLVEDPAKQRDYLLRVQNKITGLNRLTDELFRLIKLEARQVEFARRLIPAAKLVQNIYEKYAPDVSAAEIQYKLENPEKFTNDWPLLLIDSDHLDRVFENLILNAVKFTPKGGTITLSCEQLGHDVLFKITDTGSGIAEKDLPYIFERFYMGSKARTSTIGGSGLGLTIAKEIVEYHGGSIWAESIPGIGCTLLFKLPIHEAAAEF